jgi:radical SAM superfamily enzyme YgiQ (UPF0313 family)
MLRKLKLYLIKPSKYDDDGYVIRYWRGVLPSNTLVTLDALTAGSVARRALGDIKIETHLLDDSVQRIPVESICRASRSPHVKAAVMLVGVQTNQFPRAADLARQFRRAGVEVWIGGFHVSGMLAMFPRISPEIQELLDLGVTVVKGEVEHRWDELLRDLVNGAAQPLYDFIADPPSLLDAPLPRINRSYLRRFVYSDGGTLDCGRGCPFDCSFCCIINVQGRKMRYRDPQAVLQALRENYHKSGTHYYFFTDDNFARNKHWEAIFDGLIQLRESEGLPLTFMMQADVLSYRIPNFIEKARRAGCSQVFLGIESINADNLKAAGKRQNSLEAFRKLTAAWHSADVSTHAAYIIGFPHDTPASVRADLRFLSNELQVEQASFFMLGPLPGSRDHCRLVNAGQPLDPDYNRYDSFHPAMPHPHMSAEEWFALYRECWRTFYSFENMRAILSRVPAKNYWSVFRNFIWYKSAAEIEGEHPMIAGFWRIKERRARRPGYPVAGRWAHFTAQLHEKTRQLRQWVALLVEMEELWLQTRPPTRLEQRLLEDLQRLREREAEWATSFRLPELPTANIVELRRGLHDWTNTVLPAILQQRREALGASLSPLRERLTLPPINAEVGFLNLWSRIPADLRDWIMRVEKHMQSVSASRRSLDWFWLQQWHHLRRGRFWRVRPAKATANLTRDLVLTFRFAWALLSGSGRTAMNRS